MSVNGFAQKSIHHFDSLTLVQLENRDWKKLIATGKQAVKEKKEFYYLYYRMGAAFYNLKKYRKAQHHFEKAYQYNQFDDELKESLFNTMKLNENYDEAYRFSKTFSDSLKIKTETEKLVFINQLDASFAMNNPDSASYSQEGIQNYPLFSKYIFGVGLNHRIGRGISLYHHYSGTSLNTTLYKFYQSHYFLEANIPLIKHFIVQPSVGFISQKTFFTNLQINPDKNSYYLFSLNLKKSIPFFDFNISGSASDFYKVNQLQFTGGIKFYPLCNSKISFGAEYLGMNQQNSYYQSGFSLSGSYKPFSFLQFNASYFNGDSLYNQNNENGFVLNDNSALLKSRWIAGCSIFLPHKITLDFMYGRDSKIYPVINPFTSVHDGSIKYGYNFFSASFKINF
ncbi:hypothetical protein LBMAG27_15120 [Bacteroidota bacterium]|nr:hypothetical protein LBMAG27_15120 [Bacteroidota bacterium]